MIQIPYVTTPQYADSFLLSVRIRNIEVPVYQSAKANSNFLCWKWRNKSQSSFLPGHQYPCQSSSSLAYQQRQMGGLAFLRLKFCLLHGVVGTKWGRENTRNWSALIMSACSYRPWFSPLTLPYWCFKTESHHPLTVQTEWHQVPKSQV